jgi:hypothetical protein
MDKKNNVKVSRTASPRGFAHETESISLTEYFPIFGDASRKGILRTLRPSKNHSTKRKRSRIQLQRVLRENWCWEPAALCWRFSVPHGICSHSVPRAPGRSTSRHPYRVIERQHCLAYIIFPFLRCPLSCLLGLRNAKRSESLIVVALHSRTGKARNVRTFFDS